MTGIYKDSKIIIDISAIRESPHTPGTTYYSWDRRTGRKDVQFLRNGTELNLATLQNLEIEFIFVFVDHDNHEVRMCTSGGGVVFGNRTRGEAHVILPNDLYQCWGEVRIKTFLTWINNGEVNGFDAGEIVTEFQESWIDKTLPQLEQFSWRRLENFLDDFRAEMADIISQTNDFKTNYMREFLEWFEGAKDTLSGDVAGNLFNMIWEHERKIIFETPTHGIYFEDGRQLVYIPRVGWVHVANAFRANWAQRDAMGLTWAQRDAMALTWIELDNMKGVIR